MSGEPTIDATRGPAGTAALPAELPAGHTLDQFRVVAPLGRGGMGVVYEAEDTLLHRRVAVKVVRQTPHDTAAVLLREARAAAKLEHPNVVRVLHVGRWDGGYYLVLELMPGGSLQTQLKGNRRLRWDAALRAVAQACCGLHAAHAAGLVHRDVKPGNLLLDSTGRVKVADFGLVRGGELSTTAGGTAGTPHYMSPEQCRGEPADARSDVYALGASLFALLTGRPPFPLPTAVQVMFAHCTQPPPDPCDLVPGVPAGCGAVVKRAMAKEPADRYPSAEAMHAALKALTANISGEPAPPEPLPLPLLDADPETLPPDDVTRPVAPRRPLRRRRWVGWVVGGVLAGILLLAAVTLAVLAVTRLAFPRSAPTTVVAPPAVGETDRQPPQDGAGRAVALSKDGKTLASGDDAGTVRRWDVSNAGGR